MFFFCFRTFILVGTYALTTHRIVFFTNEHRNYRRLNLNFGQFLK